MQKVIPAILTADPVELRAGLKVLKNNTQWVHIDIMDGRFVPNTSVSLFELGEACQFFHIEVHLLVEHPGKYVEDCKAIGAKRVIFHAEATENMYGMLEQIEEYGFQNVVGINPETQVAALQPYLARLDSVLVMAVHPGAQGQAFMEDTLSKVPEIRNLRQDMVVGIDGGIGKDTIQQAFAAGVDYVIAGSAVMKQEDPVAALKTLQEVGNGDIIE
jgi:ribulose-phosphate 3-epimerase